MGKDGGDNHPMKISSYSNRIGGFAAVNTGMIKDCYSDAKMKHDRNIAGFVAENAGEISGSLVKKRTYGKENIGCFYLKNKGKISDCGFLRSSGKTKPIDKKYVDTEMIVEHEDIAEIFQKLKLGNAWVLSNKRGAELDHVSENYSFGPDTAGMDAIEISDDKQLFAIAAAIAGGDADAASAYYKLTKDINLHGKKWIPIGISESAPFSGVFDGCGHKIYGFKIEAEGLGAAGFFGYVSGGRVANLALDCVMNASGGTFSGCMCGVNDKGVFINCRVIAKVSADKACGGFIGKNTGLIARCAFIGQISKAVPLIIFFLPFLGVLLVLLIVGMMILIQKFSKTPYIPEVIDPNQVPVVDTGTYDPPPAGSERISIEMNQDAYFNVATQVGMIDFVNPKRGTKDLVIRVMISDAELLRTIGKTGRTAEEQAKLEAEEGYDPETSYQELFRSGLIQIGYALELAKLGALPDGTTLPVGDYEMMVVVDAYDPETNEKSVLKTQLPIQIHMIESAE